MRHSSSANNAHCHCVRSSGADASESTNFCLRHCPATVRLWRSLNSGMVHCVSNTHLSYSSLRDVPSAGCRGELMGLVRPLVSVVSYTRLVSDVTDAYRPR